MDAGSKSGFKPDKYLSIQIHALLNSYLDLLSDMLKHLTITDKSDHIYLGLTL